MSEIKYLDPEQANSIPSIKQQFRFVKKALEDGQTIPDIDQIRANAAKGATAYQKPSGGIPASDLDRQVHSALAKAEGAVSVPGEPGTVGQVLQLDSQGNPAWVTPSAGTTPDSEMSTSSTNAVQNKVITKELNDKYAKKDGFYESMGVGTAVNLAGQIERTNDSTYRTSGGSEDIATGTARIEKVSGNTIVWNQLAKKQSTAATSNGVTFTPDNNGYIYVNGTATSTATSSKLFLQTIQGHVYYVFGCPSGGSDTTYRLRFTIGNISELGNGKIFTSNGTQENLCVSILEGYTAENLAFRPQLFDLTLIYGEEVANSMAANQEWGISKFKDDYKQWFGKPLTYEPYNEGELIPVKMTGLKTTGFNQWDEEWEVGAYNTSTAQKTQSASVVRCVNRIPVIPNQQYYIKNAGIKGSNYYIWGLLLDGNNALIKNPFNTGNNYFQCNNTKITIPYNARYFIFYIIGTTTYNNDICINLHWSGTKGGTYEPYEEHILPFDVTTLQGKLNGEGELVTPFADGLKKVGSVQDEIYYVDNKVFGVKRVGSVDLGSFTYKDYIAPVEETYPYGHTSAVSIQGKKNGSYNVVSSNYTIDYSFNNNKTFVLSLNSNALSIVNSAFVDYTGTQIKSAMSGVMLYYELETPLVYELEGVELPARYRVNDWGTEEQLHAENVNSAPAILSVLYGVNAVDELRNLPRRFVTISANGIEDTMHKFLAALGTAMGGTWAITVNENDPTDFDFTFTPNNESDNSSDLTNEGE